MADIEVTRQHTKTHEEAKRIAERLVAKLSEQFDLKHHWDGDTLKFERSGVTGQLLITASELKLSAKLGMLLKPLKSRIEQEITAVLDRQLR